MRLFQCDAHLGLTRLHLARGDLPAARESFNQAHALVHACGYHRRDRELEDLRAQLTQLTQPS